ncbi:MAG: acetyl-CoA carboxylase biotin carboxyl carrier protein [Acetobacteraceae bacterium]
MPSFEEIAEIVRVLDASACEELILETAELRLVVRRRAGGQAEPAPVPPAPAGPASLPASPPATADTTGDAAGDAAGAVAVRSPMVGTFHRAPAPGDPPFVEVGSRVGVGDKLCILEVMKLFTTIRAEVAGRILPIPLADGAPVQYGQILFLIEPA